MSYNEILDELNAEHNGKVAIYVRVSTEYQVDKDSLPMQKKDLINYCKLILGINDYVIFEDAGFSGKNTNRPAYQEMMERIKKGEFTHLLVWKLDRISRNLMDFAQMYDELHKLNVTFVSKNEQFQTDSAIGKAMLRLIMVFAEMEREVTSERVTATMISRAHGGQWNGGRVPYGYSHKGKEDSFHIVPEEADFVKRVFSDYIDYKSLVRMCSMYNEEGLRTRAGKEWNPVSLRIILKNQWYIGNYVYNKTNQSKRYDLKDEKEWVVIKDHHEPIIDKGKFELVQSILTENKKSNTTRFRKEQIKMPHIFQGLLVCMQCGSTYTCTPSTLRVSGWKGTVYLCPNKRRHQSDCRNTSDATVGPFIINYILNMMNAKREFKNIKSIKELKKRLISGPAFEHVVDIDDDGVEYTYEIFASNSTSQSFLKGNPKKRKQSYDHDIRKLEDEKEKLERAMERLRNLYLFEDSGMSETEYIIERKKLTDSMEEVDDKISKMLKNGAFEQKISDDELISIASNYILQEKLSGKDYIDFEALCTYTDRDMIKLLMQSVIQVIYMDYGKVRSIVFNNGIKHTFVYDSDEKNTRE